MNKSVEIIKKLTSIDTECLIQIPEEITITNSPAVIKQLQRISSRIYNGENITDIIISITSKGGNNVGSMGIIIEIERLKELGVTIYTIVYNFAGSNSAIIAMLGTHGCRYITKDSGMLFHQCRATQAAVATYPVAMLTKVTLRCCTHWENDKKRLIKYGNFTKDQLEKLDAGMDLEFSCDEIIIQGIMDHII